MTRDSPAQLRNRLAICSSLICANQCESVANPYSLFLQLSCGFYPEFKIESKRFLPQMNTDFHRSMQSQIFQNIRPFGNLAACELNFYWPDALLDFSSGAGATRRRIRPSVVPPTATGGFEPFNTTTWSRTSPSGVGPISFHVSPASSETNRCFVP